MVGKENIACVELLRVTLVLSFIASEVTYTVCPLFDEDPVLLDVEEDSPVEEDPVLLDVEEEDFPVVEELDESLAEVATTPLVVESVVTATGRGSGSSSGRGGGGGCSRTNSFPSNSV